MSKPENRLQMMARLGAKIQNTQWAWCAVDEVNKKVYFSAWVDMKIQKERGPAYIIQEPDWGIDQTTGKANAGRNDQDNKLDLVFNQGYQAFAYFVEAEDIKAIPRVIKNIKTSFVFSLELEKLDDGSIVGYPIERFNVK